MEVKGKLFPGVEINLTNGEAAELAHILSIYRVGAERGDFGRGTSIDKQIELSREISAKISERISE